MTGPVSIIGFHAFLLGSVIAKFLHLRSTPRAEFLDNGLLFGGCRIQQFQDLLAYLGGKRPKPAAGEEEKEESKKGWLFKHLNPGDEP